MKPATAKPAEPSAAEPAATGRRDAMGSLLMLSGAVWFGAIVILMKLFQQESSLGVFSTLALRFGLAALLLAALLLAMRRPLRPAPGEGRWLFAMGAVGYAAEASLFFAALRHGTAAAVTLVFYTYPVFVALVSISLHRKRPHVRLVGALVLALGGVAIVAASSEGIDISGTGLALALGAALTYTAYPIGAEFKVRRTGPLVGALWASGAVSVGLFAFAAASGTLGLPSTSREWLLLAGMALATVMAFVCLLEGVRRVGALRGSIISSTEPLAAAILGFLVLSEHLSTGTAFGGLVILAGAVLASIARPAPPEPSF